MPKPPQFPITVKAGATAIKIYRNPLRVPITSGPEANTGAVTSYDSYLVVHYRAGKRQRQRFNSLELAQTEVARVRALLLNEDASGLQLTGRDLLAFSQANRVAQQFGVSLDTLANEHAAAKKILGEVSVLEAAQFYDRYGKTVKEKKTVSAVAEELIAGLKADHKSDYHIRDMERRLRIFAQQFTGFITEVETKAISEWLRNLKGTDNDGKDIIFAPKTRNHYRNAVVQLFNYARDHGYLPKGMPTEVEGVKPLDVVPSENEIFTVEEMIELLNHAPEHLIAPLAIKAFSGVRTEEMVRMDWSAVNFETRHITLSADVTKTKQRRLIPMPDNLVAWLAPLKGRTGRISARWVTPQTLVQAFDRFGRNHEIHVGANKFRNSYITYRVAVTHDIQRVSLESGNSAQVIQREYLELATENDGKRWFNIFPQAATVPPAVETKVRTSARIKRRK